MLCTTCRATDARHRSMDGGSFSAAAGSPAEGTSPSRSAAMAADIGSELKSAVPWVAEEPLAEDLAVATAPASDEPPSWRTWPAPRAEDGALRPSRLAGAAVPRDDRAELRADCSGFVGGCRAASGDKKHLPQRS
mmetsp:Transcript_18773/g.53044  ORF Transcript_18773/g.53044 Transcript_18773/m.53044 type:complete len:135 (+) Transcript_18773:143-547(+)